MLGGCHRLRRVYIGRIWLTRNSQVDRSSLQIPSMKENTERTCVTADTTFAKIAIERIVGQFARL